MQTPPPSLAVLATARRLVARALAGLIVLLCLAAPLARAQTPPPASFTRTISTGSDSVTVNFTLHPIRTANFKVLVQGVDGTFTEFAADVPRTYLGTVTGYPGALASAVMRADGTVYARVGFENGIEWVTYGGAASIRGSTNWTPAWPTTVVGSGGAGSSVRGAEVGMDLSYRQYLACGSDPVKALDMAEFCLISADYIYLRDAAILMKMGRVLIRADQTQDPYEPDGGDTGLLLPHIRDQWNTTIPATVGATHDLALVARPGAGGGLAYVGTIATSSRYSADGADANGDFYVIWRHEAGHNWGSSHYEGGGKPEGPTIMSDNSLSRFSSSELAKIIAHRNTKLASLDDLGPYPFPLPPRANMDRAVFLPGSPLTIDVMNNDSDSNGEAVHLLSFDATSPRGSTITRSVGTGPNGRDQLIYTPAVGYEAGNDSFTYHIEDAAGYRALGYVVVGPIGELAPLDRWTLDDASGSTAVDSIRTSLNGTHSGATVNQAGATSVTGKAVSYNGTSSRTSTAAPGYNTNVLTITGWVKRNGTQTSQAGIVYTGSSSTGTGLCFGPSNVLRFQWNGVGYSAPPVPTLTVPDGQWCLVAMSVSPNDVTVHLRTPDGLQSAVKTGTFAASSFSSSLYFGRNGSSSQYYKGLLDDIRVYPATLSADQIESLYQQATNPPTLTVTSPAAGVSVAALAVPLTATAANGGVDSLVFLDGTTPLGTFTEEPYALSVPWFYPGSHTVTARGSYGDWGYTVDSLPVTFTVQAPPLPVVTVVASGTPSRSGPVSGSFVISRNHPIGAATVPFSVGGTAVVGTDYNALPASVSLPDGTLSATVSVDPIGSGTPLGDKTVIVTLQPDASYTAGTPSTATQIIGDHITSIASTAWNLDTTWTNALAAPVTGTQGAGLDYAVAHTVASNNTGSNSQALIGKSLRIQSGGILDLTRIHSATLQTVTYNLPPLTLQDGGAIRFTASLGSDLHVIPAAIAVSGSTSLLINGGSYDNGAALNGAISGSGTLHVISQSNAGSGTYVRTVTVGSANNPFSGNWTVEHTPTSTDDSAGLRANAANALGTGSVTVGNRARLTNDIANGLNSLSGVILNGTSSSLVVNQTWNKATASLALSGGDPVVTLNNAAAVTLGNLTGSVGTIKGGTSVATLTVNPTVNGTFAGALGTNLRFAKSGPADLQLTGALDPTLQLTLSNGGLGFGGGAPAVASLVQSGGQLQLLAGGSTAARLALSGSYTRSGGGITLTALDVPAMNVPHTLVSYGGTRSGTPAFTFVNLTGIPLEPAVNYGAASASAITVVYRLPFTDWAAGYGLSGPDALATADPDHDGMTNEQERLLGFDPRNPGSRLVLSLVSMDATTVHLRLNRVTTGGTFFLQTSDTLAGAWTETPLTVAVDGSDLPINLLRSGAKRFYRVVFRTP